MKHVIYSLPQAPFRKQDVQRIMKNMRISEKSWKLIQKCHIFFAAGAFSQTRCSNNREKYEDFWRKYGKRKTLNDIICSLLQAPFRQQNVQKIMENMRISRKSWKIIKQCHLLFAAGAFSPNKYSKHHEQHENF